MLSGDYGAASKAHAVASLWPSQHQSRFQVALTRRALVPAARLCVVLLQPQLAVREAHAHADLRKDHKESRT